MTAADEQPAREAGSPAASPAGLDFNIAFNSRTGTDAGFASDAYHEHGVMTFGARKLSFRERHIDLPGETSGAMA